MPSKDKETRNQTNSNYYHRNRERILEKAKQVNKAKYEENRDRLRANMKRWIENNPEAHILNRTRASAKNRGLEFNLTLDDIVIPEVCPYLGIPLTQRLDGNGRSWSSASVDRMDPTKGYVKGNIEIISTKANTMKNNASPEELLMFAQNVIKKHESDEEIKQLVRIS